VLRPARAAFVVRREGERFRVVGRNVERWVAEVDLDDPRAVAALQKRLVRAGVERALEDEGARAGDEIVIGSAAFDFRPGASIDDALRAALEDGEDGDSDAAADGGVGGPS
jgi:GTP-binding protein